MLMRQPNPDHFMVGEQVDVELEDETVRGEIQNVIEITTEDETGKRETHKRIIVDADGREIDAGLSKVEVVR